MAAGLLGMFVKPVKPITLPIAPIKTGTELVMVFIASSTCTGAKDPELKNALERVRRGLKREAREKKQVFTSIGISLDWSIDAGVQMLDSFGPFDEIAVGRGWMNTGAVKFLWEDLPGEAAVPQLVVVERVVTKDRAIHVTGERVRYRKIGAPGIATWSRLAFPSPLPR